MINVTQAWAGDLLFRFSEGVTQEPSQKEEAWSRILGTKSITLFTQPPTSTWKGAPLLTVHREAWDLWFLGELYGSSRDPRAIEEAIYAVATNSVSPANLNGHWLLFGWNSERRALNVWTDRFGTFHAYTTENGATTAIGTHFRSVARAVSSKELDWEGLTGFFGCGFFPQDRTHYSGVRILKPASHYAWGGDGKKISERRYWEWSHEPDFKRNYEDTVSEFGARFGEVMKEMLQDGRIAIPISGGLDSRSTVAAVNNSKPQDRFWSYSYGYSDDSVETEIATQIARARGLAFKAFTIKPYLFENMGRVLNSVEGFQDVTQCRQAFISKELGERADYVIAAHWGDVWLDGMGLCGKSEGLPDRNQVIDHTIKKMAKRGRAWLFENICKPRLGSSEPEQMLREFTAEGLNAMHHIQDPDFRIKAFKTDNWSFRWTLSSIRMFQAAALPRLPFYDTRLADFFGTVPSAQVAGRRLQVDFLKSFSPDLAQIKWQAHNADLYNYQKSKTWKLPGRVIKKAARVLSGKKLIERNWEVQFYGEKGTAGLTRLLLDPGLRLHEFVKKEKVESLLQDFRAEPLKEGRGYTVSMLLTFSAWLENETLSGPR